MPRLFAGLAAEAWAAGAVAASNHDMPATLRRDLARVAADLGTELPEDVLARGMMLWSAIMGAVSTEVFGQLGHDTFSRPHQLFEHHVAVLLDAFGLTD